MMQSVTDDLLMMEQHAFLRTITDDFSDDTPRLVFADWLEECGFSERAEFIRLQCELSRLDTGDPRRRELETREVKLWNAHGHQWAAHILNSGILFGDIKFCRGFLYEVIATPSAMPLLGNLLTRFSTVRRLIFDAITRFTLPQIANQATIGVVPEIDFRLSGLGDRGCELLANHCNWLKHVQSLSLAGNTVTDFGASLIANSPALSTGTPKLVELNLNANNIGDAGIRELAVSPAMSGLKRLKLAENQLTDQGAAWIGRTDTFSLLEELDLSKNRLSERVIVAILRSPKLPKLRTLIFDNVQSSYEYERSRMRRFSYKTCS